MARRSLWPLGRPALVASLLLLLVVSIRGQLSPLPRLSWSDLVANEKICYAYGFTGGFVGDCVLQADNAPWRPELLTGGLPFCPGNCPVLLVLSVLPY